MFTYKSTTRTIVDEDFEKGYLQGIEEAITSILGMLAQEDIDKVIKRVLKWNKETRRTK